MIPTGKMVEGKCTDCGDWWYTKEKGPNGRWIETGVNQWGKMTYKQHVHDCRGPSGGNVQSLHQKVSTMATDAREFVKDRAQSDHLNVIKMSGDLIIVKEDVQACKQYLETIIKKQGLFESANTMRPQHIDIGSGTPPPRPQLNVDSGDSSDESTLVEELSDTDDTTQSDENSASINFMDRRNLETD